MSRRRWLVEAWELPDGRLVLGGQQGAPTWAAWMERLAGAVERELAGEDLGLPGLCPAALGTEGSTVAARDDRADAGSR